jgi:hypothetical protein
VDDPPDGAVVSEGEELLPAGVPGVPAAQRGRRLVRKHHVVLRVVEYGLRAVLLLPGSSRTSKLYITLLLLVRKRGEGRCTRDEDSSVAGSHPLSAEPDLFHLDTNTPQNGRVAERNAHRSQRCAYRQCCGIRIGFNADPDTDPAFFVNADPDLGI